MPVSPSVAAPPAAHSGASPAHAHHHPVPAAVRLGASVLRLSLAARLALAAAFLAPLWIAVFLVAGGAP